MLPTNISLLHTFKRVGHIPDQFNPTRTQVSLKLYVDSSSALEYILFEPTNRACSLLDFNTETIDKVPVDFCYIVITAPLHWWADFCKRYYDEQLIVDLEDFFYKNYLKGWVKLGLV